MGLEEDPQNLARTLQTREYHHRLPEYEFLKFAGNAVSQMKFRPRVFWQVFPGQTQALQRHKFGRGLARQCGHLSLMIFQRTGNASSGFAGSGAHGNCEWNILVVFGDFRNHLFVLWIKTELAKFVNICWKKSVQPFGLNRPGQKSRYYCPPAGAGRLLFEWLQWRQNNGSLAPFSPPP